MAAERHHNRSRVILLATTACFSLLLGGCGNSSADVNSLEPSSKTQEAPATETQPSPVLVTTSNVASATGDTTSSGSEATTVSPDAPSSSPSSSTAPLWVQSANLFRWTEVPNSRIDASAAWSGYAAAAGTLGKSGLLAYSGAAIRASTSEFFLAGGGHLDYAGNEIHSLRLDVERPDWVRRIDPSVETPMNTPYYPDGRPSSRHTYWNIQFIDTRDRLMFFGGPQWGDKPQELPYIDGFDASANQYDPAGTYPSQNGFGGVSGVAKDAVENVWIHSRADGHVYQWVQSANKILDFGYRKSMVQPTGHAVDTKRNRMFRLGTSASDTAYYFDLSDDAQVVPVSVSGNAAAAAVGMGSIVYDPSNDAYWFCKVGANTLFRIDAETFAVTIQPVTGIVPSNTFADGRHYIYGRFNYVPRLRGIVFMHDVKEPLFFIRTAP